MDIHQGIYALPADLSCALVRVPS